MFVLVMLSIDTILTGGDIVTQLGPLLFMHLFSQMNTMVEGFATAVVPFFTCVACNTSYQWNSE